MRPARGPRWWLGAACDGLLGLVDSSSVAPRGRQRSRGLDGLEGVVGRSRSLRGRAGACDGLTASAGSRRALGQRSRGIARACVPHGRARGQGRARGRNGLASGTRGRPASRQPALVGVRRSRCRPGRFRARSRFSRSLRESSRSSGGSSCSLGGAEARGGGVESAHRGLVSFWARPRGFREKKQEKQIVS